LQSIRELLFPFKPRRDGAVFDGFVSNLAADRFPLEELKVPTLVISAKDDPLAPHRFAVEAAGRIPGARLVAIDGGGHLFLGHHAEVGREVTGFVASILASQADDNADTATIRHSSRILRRYARP
jgi:pimeloyl-ACP methyl ester carboxylesterase